MVSGESAQSSRCITFPLLRLNGGLELRGLSRVGDKIGMRIYVSNSSRFFGGAAYSYDEEHTEPVNFQGMATGQYS